LEHRSLAYRSHATSGLDLSQFNVAAQSSEGWFVIEETRTVFFNPIGNLTVQDLYLVAPAMPEPASVFSIVRRLQADQRSPGHRKMPALSSSLQREW